MLCLNNSSQTKSETESKKTKNNSRTNLNWTSHLPRFNWHKYGDNFFWKILTKESFAAWLAFNKASVEGQNIWRFWRELHLSQTLMKHNVDMFKCLFFCQKVWRKRCCYLINKDSIPKKKYSFYFKFGPLRKTQLSLKHVVKILEVIRSYSKHQKVNSRLKIQD